MKFFVIALFVISVANCQHTKPHYGNPANGCRLDEIDGAMGTHQWCAPSCDNNACPTDLPAGANGVTPTCNVETEDGHFYCSLVCNIGKTCPTGATCFHASKTQSFLMARTLFSRERRLQSASGLCGYPL